MSKENINNSEITNKELIESIEEEIDGKIKKEGMDIDEISKIAEDLKNKGLFVAGDELKNEAFRIWRQNLINQELEK
ncbi:MAG: hypothetical protein AAB396_00160 [Patescibacteria group bacterium]